MSLACMPTLSSIVAPQCRQPSLWFESKQQQRQGVSTNGLACAVCSVSPYSQSDQLPGQPNITRAVQGTTTASSGGTHALWEAAFQAIHRRCASGRKADLSPAGEATLQRHVSCCNHVMLLVRWHV